MFYAMLNIAWISEGNRIVYGTLESDQNEIWLITKNATYVVLQHGEWPKNVTYGVNVKLSMTFFVDQEYWICY